MAKTAKRMRVKNRINAYQKAVASQYSTPNRPQITIQTYDAYRFIKKDMKWSALIGGIVVLVLIITYVFLH